jgi:hypothetical protein
MIRISGKALIQLSSIAHSEEQNGNTINEAFFGFDETSELP